MSAVAAAIGIAAVAGVAGSAIAGSEAAGATRDASNAAISEQQAALNQQAQLSQPYRDLGQSGISKLQTLLGIAPAGSPAGSAAGSAAGQSGQVAQFGVDPGTGSGLDRNGMSLGQMPPKRGGLAGVAGGAVASLAGGAPASATGGQPAQATSPLDALRSMPGYQFQQQQGTQNTINAASAQGMSLSGNTLKGLSEFNQGLADTTYQQEVGDLQNVVSTGQAAAAGQAANVGNAAANIGNTLVNQGNTLAGIDANVAAGISKSVGNASNQYVTNQTLQGLNNPNNNPSNWDTENPNNFQDFQSSDRRLKTDIQLVGRLDCGLNVYTFRYAKSPATVHMGVMADEVQSVIPDAVSIDSDGYLQVRYGMLH